jgi:hypothetical protein
LHAINSQWVTHRSADKCVQVLRVHISGKISRERKIKNKQSNVHEK